MAQWLIIKTIILTTLLLIPAQSIAPQVETPLQVIETTTPAVCNSYRQEVEKYDWNIEVAMNVMYAESGCNPLAINKTDNHGKCLGSYGLFQISCTTSTTTTPSENIKIAYEDKYKKGGWGHWSVCKSIKGKTPIVNCYQK